MTVTSAERRTTGWRADDSTFGARLALIRQKMAWGNVKEAAAECGLPSESWRTWERDNVIPRRHVEIAALIAARTGCDYWWLLVGPIPQAQGAEDPQVTHRKPHLTDRTRPNSRPQRTQPPESTRRPARLPAAHTHLVLHTPEASPHWQIPTPDGHRHHAGRSVKHGR